MDLFEAAWSGDIESLTRTIENNTSLEVRDENGWTPLMVAVESPQATVAAVKWLLDCGADPNAKTIEPKPFEFDAETLEMIKESGVEIPSAPPTSSSESVLAIAVRNSSCDKIATLINAGADVSFVDDSGYGIFLLACYGAFGRSHDENVRLFCLLKDSGTPFGEETKYGETVASVLSNHAYFELLKVVLDLGADAAPLKWNPLFYSIAFEEIGDTTRVLDGDDGLLERRDAWDRTPFLVAVASGKLDVARLLVERGCDINAKGRCGQTALMYAVESNHENVCEWLIGLGCDVHESDEFDQCALKRAVGSNAVECARILVDAGADAFQRGEYGFGLMHDVGSPEMFELLVGLGLNPGEVDGNVRKELCGTHESQKLNVSEQQYLDDRPRHFGTKNPQRVNNPFWDAMVRTRLSACEANDTFGRSSLDLESPTWCFSRVGQSFTQLPDGRFVEIGGEHEDHYDPDFCIYNDVVVHHGNGEFDILGYPKEVFPPTDFHSATYLNEQIVIIGSIGYPEDRQIGQTPVYLLSCRDWSIKRIKTSGQCPGWIGSHIAVLTSDNDIKVRFGQVGTEVDLVDNEHEWVLDVTAARWSKLD